jgi:hypothetical protein
VTTPIFNAIAGVLQKTDYRRWTNPRSLEQWWEARTEKAASFIPNGSRVIEFGAGHRALERYLDPSCTYVPSDIVDRGPGTLVHDLNQRPLPDLGADVYDVAVLMGVLEYIRDVPAVLDWLTELVPVVVLSYVCVTANRHSLRGMRDRANRLGVGWMNNYREEELRSLFHERGYACLRAETWENNRLFVFSRRR